MQRTSYQKYRAILETLSRHGKLNIAQIMLYSNISYEGAKEFLDKMIASGSVRRFNTTYSITAIGNAILRQHDKTILI